MLQNAYLLAKIGVDTAENERNFAEKLPKFGNYPTGPLPYVAAALRLELGAHGLDAVEGDLSRGAVGFKKLRDSVGERRVFSQAIG